MYLITIPPGLTSLSSDTLYTNSGQFTTNRFGQTASALIFNGVAASYARSKSVIASTVNNNFTMSIWALAQSASAIGSEGTCLLMPIQGYVNYGSGNAGTGLYMNSSTISLVGHSDNYGPTFITANVQTGKWNQIVVTCSNNVFVLYVNGIAVGTNNQSGAGYTFHPSSGDPYSQSEIWIPEGGGIGAFCTYNNNTGYLDSFMRFVGAASDFRIYNRALLASEVSGLNALESAPIVNIQKAVYLTSANLLVGTNYQVQASTDLINWTNQGSVFTATTNSWRSTNYWDVANWNQLFFRLQQQ